MKYEDLDDLERAVDKLEAETAQLKRKVENCINELEVEHFLLYGPGGVDPMEQ